MTIEEGVNFARICAAIVIFCVGLIFLCCCAAGLVLHDYFVNQRNKEIEKELNQDLI